MNFEGPLIWCAHGDRHHDSLSLEVRNDCPRAISDLTRENGPPHHRSPRFTSSVSLD